MLYFNKQIHKCRKKKAEMHSYCVNKTPVAFHGRPGFRFSAKGISTFVASSDCPCSCVLTKGVSFFAAFRGRPRLRFSTKVTWFSSAFDNRLCSCCSSTKDVSFVVVFRGRPRFRFSTKVTWFSADCDSRLCSPTKDASFVVVFRGHPRFRFSTKTAEGAAQDVKLPATSL
jgi:hypothetical protein